MSNNAGPNAQTEEVNNATAPTAESVAAVEKTASPVKQQQQPKASEPDAGTGEESRDSVNSVGEESAEGDEEEEEVGDEEATDEDSQHAKPTNGHPEKNGHPPVKQPEADGDAAVAAAELANGEPKSRKRTSGGPEEAEDPSSQKKKRMDGEQPAEPEAQTVE